MIEIVETTQKSNCVVIKLSTHERLILPLSSMNMYNMSKGRLIEAEEYRQLKEESDRYACKKKAFDYLAIRNRSARELEVYLYRKGFSRDHVIEVLKSLEENGYINDYDFSVSYIQFRKRKSVIGKNLLIRDLRKKGIKRELIQRALRVTNASEVDNEQLYGLALKKLNNVTSKKNRQNKLEYFLYQRGFEADDIRKVIERLKKEGFSL